MARCPCGVLALLVPVELPAREVSIGGVAQIAVVIRVVNPERPVVGLTDS